MREAEAGRLPGGAGGCQRRGAGGPLRAPTLDRHTGVALAATPDPAGTVVTRTAGLATLHATLRWDVPRDAPAGPLVTGDVSEAEVWRLELTETSSPDGTVREVSGTVLALYEWDLGAALERVLRNLAVGAAVSDAVLETRAARVRTPRATPLRLVEGLALDLWGAGFPVRFAPSWTPAPEGSVALGFGGDDGGLEGYLRESPRWQIV